MGAYSCLVHHPPPPCIVYMMDAGGNEKNHNHILFRLTFVSNQTDRRCVMACVSYLLFILM